MSVLVRSPKWCEPALDIRDGRGQDIHAPKEIAATIIVHDMPFSTAKAESLLEAANPYIGAVRAVI